MATVTINFGHDWQPLKVLKRSCGTCTLCCTLVPVAELKKAANTKCQHQFSKGCRIYQKRPMSCRVWSCAWLTNESTRELSRPDRSHYVIDPTPFTATAIDEGRVFQIEVSEIWIDPKYPDAHRDPALRRWIQKSGKPAAVRFGNTRGLTIVPPELNRDGQWLETETQMPSRQEAREQGLEWAVEK